MKLTKKLYNLSLTTAKKYAKAGAKIARKGWSLDEHIIFECGSFTFVKKNARASYLFGMVDGYICRYEFSDDEKTAKDWLDFKNKKEDI